jgi:hypothetical protein
MTTAADQEMPWKGRGGLVEFDGRADALIGGKRKEGKRRGKRQEYEDGRAQGGGDYKGHEVQKIENMKGWQKDSR